MKTQTITYKLSDMQNVGQLLNCLTVTGTDNFKALAVIAQILDSGTVGELYEKESNENGVHNEAVQSN